MGRLPFGEPGNEPAVDCAILKSDFSWCVGFQTALDKWTSRVFFQEYETEETGLLAKVPGCEVGAPRLSWVERVSGSIGG